MKIAFYSDNFYPELSGITDSVMMLGEALVKRGHQVMYVAPSYTERDYRAIGLNKHSLADGKNIFEFRLPSLPLPGSPTGHSRVALPIGFGLPALKKFAPDVIHTQSPFGVGIEALLDAKILGIPFVGTNHTPPSEFVAHFPIKAEWFKKLSIKFYCGYYNRCSFVATPCQSLLAEMRHFNFYRPGQVISNPIELSHFQPAASEEKKQELKKQFGLAGRTILYTGRLAEEKHVDVIIRSLKKILAALPDVQLVITGHGSAEKALHDLVARLDLQEKVKFLGYVDKEKFPLLYQASDLFVLMSTAESQSLSLFQAMSTSLPVIGARARALPEYINKESGVIVEPGDEEKLAEEAIRILSDRELSESLGRGGRQTSKLADPVAVAAEWEKIYQQAIEEKRRGKRSKN